MQLATSPLGANMLGAPLYNPVAPLTLDFSNPTANDRTGSSRPTYMKIKRNDTAVTFADTLTINGQPADLTGCEVRFIMRLGHYHFDQPAEIIDPLLGKVSFGPGLLPIELGKYKQEWEVTFGNGLRLTFPSDSYNTVEIITDLD